MPQRAYRPLGLHRFSRAKVLKILGIRHLNPIKFTVKTNDCGAMDAWDSAYRSDGGVCRGITSPTVQEVFHIGRYRSAEKHVLTRHRVDKS